METTAVAHEFRLPLSSSLRMSPLGREYYGYLRGAIVSCASLRRFFLALVCFLMWATFVRCSSRCIFCGFVYVRCAICWESVGWRKGGDDGTGLIWEGAAGS